MIIGTVRVEEARVHDAKAGYHQFHSGRRDHEPHGSFEVFFLDRTIAAQDEGEDFSPGWYWWPCFPGCLPDGDPSGPFDTEQAAIIDAQDA